MCSYVSFGFLLGLEVLKFIKIDDELDNLEFGNLFFLLDVNFMCGLEIVLVYDNVNV